MKLSNHEKAKIAFDRMMEKHNDTSFTYQFKSGYIAGYWQALNDVNKKK